MRRTILHWRLSGERAACQPNKGSDVLRPNLTPVADDVTCKRCLKLMAQAAAKLTPSKKTRR